MTISAMPIASLADIIFVSSKGKVLYREYYGEIEVDLILGIGNNQKVFELQTANEILYPNFGPHSNSNMILVGVCLR
jgi:hypothetical protein